MSENRPQGRKRAGATSSGSVNRRGRAETGGRVGNTDYGRGSGSGASRPSSGNYSSSGRGSYTPTPGGNYNRGGRGGIGGLFLLVIAFFVVKMLMSGLGGGSASVDSGSYGGNSVSSSNTTAHTWQPLHTSYNDTNSSTVQDTGSTRAREPFTKLIGNGEDQVTVLVYMCGTDLESKYGMATSDLNEMAYATHSDQVNIIVQSGGTKKWNNSVMKNNGVLQRWQVTDKALIALDRNAGSASMTDSSTLSSFIQWGTKNYPANRYILILWDHGGGSITGYGYDEVYNNGSMDVNEIAQALKAGGTKFDIMGFDACLMANVETAIAVSPYADYLLASEETEPGTGWYYTNWLSDLARNPSMETPVLAKEIIDDFISASAKSSSRDKTSLSLVDLGAFEATVPSALKDFAVELSDRINNEEYKSVADARSVSKEFAASNKIDQIDLAHFAKNLGSSKGNAMEQAVKDCVVYNRVNNMSNAYGLSIYFPYSNTRNVTKAAQLYAQIDMDDEYTDAVRSFAGLTASGQITNSATGNSLFDILGGGSSYSSSYSSGIDAGDILSLLLGGGSSTSSSGLDLVSLLGGSGDYSSSLLDGFSSYIGRNRVESTDLMLTKKNGVHVLSMPEEQWQYIHDIDLNVWVEDDGGYIDLGLDNVFEFDADGDLIAEYDGLWNAMDGQVCAYYRLSYENGVSTGYIPAMLNGEQVRILVYFDDADPQGVVLGAQKVYEDQQEAKGLIPLEDGDVIDLLCDYYDAEGNYSDSYVLGDPIIVNGEVAISTIALEDVSVRYGYCLTDMYQSRLYTNMLSY